MMVQAKYLDDIIGATAPEPPIAGLHWVSVTARNLDELPEKFVPETGCPACGSVWVELRKVGFRAPPLLTGEFNSTYWTVLTARQSEPVASVVLRCFGDHDYSFEGHHLEKYVSLWQAAVIGAVPAFVGAWAYLHKKWERA